MSGRLSFRRSGRTSPARAWGFRAPIYPRFFATVREVNQTLPAQRRTRVLLADPPFDWSSARTWQDLATALEDRDGHFARVVEREILRSGKRAFVLAGAYHLLKATWSPFPPNTGLVQILERDHPGSTYVVLPHDNLRARDRVAIAALPRAPFLTLAPDWVCEVLSPSTALLDRGPKLKVYGRERIPWVWLVDPIGRTLEVLPLDGPTYRITDVHTGPAAVRAPPFEAIELDLEAIFPAEEPDPL